MFKYKNVCLIISVALAILCLIFMIYSFCNASTGVNSVDSPNQWVRQLVWHWLRPVW